MPNSHKMLISLYPFLRNALFRLEPELAHQIGLTGLDMCAAVQRLLLPGQTSTLSDTKTNLVIWGRNFPNHVGLAAGFDKNAEHLHGLAMLGFGFIEVGTVTPRPQPGNERPRLFRIPSAQAIVNRMGFNNKGIDYIVANLHKYRLSAKESPGQCLIGVNIGKNKTTPEENAVDDYLTCLTRAYPVADYIAVNVSSPNTPGLRNLQNREALSALLTALKGKQQVLANAHNEYIPLLVKIAPDLTDEQIVEIAQVVNDIKLDGVIATNSTIDHSSVATLPNGKESGGLTGAPLFDLSYRVVKQLRATLQQEIPIIACGGITNASQAQNMQDAGAALVQIYSGLVYQGPKLISDLVFPQRS